MNGLSSDVLGCIADWLPFRHHKDFNACCVAFWMALRYRRVYRLAPLQDSVEFRRRLLCGDGPLRFGGSAPALSMAEANIQELCVTVGDPRVLRLVMEQVQVRTLRVSLLPMSEAASQGGGWGGLTLDSEVLHLVIESAATVRRVLEEGIRAGPSVRHFRLDGPVQRLGALASLPRLQRCILHGLLIPVQNVEVIGQMTALEVLDLGISNPHWESEGNVLGGSVESFLGGLATVLPTLTRLMHLRLGLSLSTFLPVYAAAVERLGTSLERMPMLSMVCLRVSPKRWGYHEVLERITRGLLSGPPDRPGIRCREPPNDVQRPPRA